MVDRDLDQPGCSLVEAMRTVVTVEAEIRTDLCRITAVGSLSLGHAQRLH